MQSTTETGTTKTDYPKCEFCGMDVKPHHQQEIALNIIDNVNVGLVHAGHCAKQYREMQKEGC